jgi:hypothetical protein
VFATSDVRLSSEDWQRVRKLLEGFSWQGSRQLDDLTSYGVGHKEYLILAPMARVFLEYGYHATRLASLDAIRRDGLLPSNPDRQMSNEQYDCDGNIYVCDKLGTPADAGVANSRSAHWWRAHLAETNRFGDPNWCIIGIDFARVPGVVLYKDLRSTTGIIIGCVESVPPEAITPVYRILDMGQGVHGHDED